MRARALPVGDNDSDSHEKGNHRDSCPFHSHVTCVYLCFPNSKLVVNDLIY